MADLTIQPDEIRAALDSFVSSYEPAKTVSEEVGHVTLTADGIAGEATLAALNAGQDNTYTVTLHGVPEAKAIALISLYNGEVHGALG